MLLLTLPKFYSHPGAYVDYFEKPCNEYWISQIDMEQNVNKTETQTKRKYLPILKYCTVVESPSQFVFSQMN